MFAVHRGIVHKLYLLAGVATPSVTLIYNRPRYFLINNVQVPFILNLISARRLPRDNRNASSVQKMFPSL
jgi:hypothetical protein